MKKSRQTRTALLLAGVLLATALGGCAKTAVPDKTASPSAAPTVAASASTAAPKTQSFTDSLGRDITVPADLTRIAPSGTLPQTVLYTLAPEKMVGWSSSPSQGMKKYFDAAYTTLPTFGTFYGKNADLNMEALIAADPQIVIDMGEVKGSRADMKADLDALQRQLNIPVVFIEASLETSGTAYRALGALLGLEDKANALADYCDTTVAQAKEYAAQLTDAQKVRVYYGEGETGLQTNPVGSFHCEVLDLVGAINVADIPITSGAGGNQIGMEQLLLWAPDTILLGPGSIYGSIGTDPLWQDLAAVQQKQVYEIPSGPYNWIDRPPAVNRILGIKWLGNLLYPELFHYDMRAETKEFYSLFYHYELTDTEVDALLAHSSK